jgi:hypothetical protein
VVGGLAGLGILIGLVLWYLRRHLTRGRPLLPLDRHPSATSRSTGRSSLFSGKNPPDEHKKRLSDSSLNSGPPPHVLPVIQVEAPPGQDRLLSTSEVGGTQLARLGSNFRWEWKRRRLSELHRQVHELPSLATYELASSSLEAEICSSGGAAPVHRPPDNDSASTRSEQSTYVLAPEDHSTATV